MKMKKIKILIFVILVTNILIAQNISFKELDAIKSKSSLEIETFLKKKDYSLINKQSNSSQWQSKDSSSIIQFNGKGVLVYLTYNYKAYKAILVDIKLEYEYTGKSVKNNVSVDSYVKKKATIFSSATKDNNSNKTIYSLTFI